MAKEFMGYRLPITDIEETIELMKIDDYMARFIAEYYQLRIRATKLERLLRKIELARIKGEKEPVHDCPDEILEDQYISMLKYMKVLEMRALAEEIDLEK